LIRFVFDPVRKRMTTVAEVPDMKGFNRRAHVKGASEIVLEACSFYLDA
jgi:magnesium-transporting ATPase (P-type)